MKASGACVQSRIPPQGVFRTLAILSILAGSGLLGAAEAAPASHGAAAKPSKAAVTTVSTKDVETTSSVQPTTDSDGYCQTSRKRLFVESEGWIVRRVTTCY